MERKLGIISECLQGVPATEASPLIKEAGFDCYFTGIYQPNEVEKVKKVGDNLGLSCDFIHAPFKGINNMWLAGMDYLDIDRKMKTSIDAAAACGIPTVIAHLSSGWKAPEITDLGLARFDALVEYADARKVNIAVENLRKIGNLAYFVDRYENMPYVGYCYDFGHEHCYTKTVSWMDIFCKKVIATHIHDNFGRGEEKTEISPDTHLLPFEGNIDYARIMRKLDEYEFEGSLVLEVNNARHREMSHQDFLATCFERIQRISKM